MKDSIITRELVNKITIMARHIAETHGTCPADLYGWEHPEGCENVCEKTANIENDSMCWLEYFNSQS